LTSNISNGFKKVISVGLYFMQYTPQHERTVSLLLRILKIINIFAPYMEPWYKRHFLNAVLAKID